MIPADAAASPADLRLPPLSGYPPVDANILPKSSIPVKYGLVQPLRCVQQAERPGHPPRAGAALTPRAMAAFIPPSPPRSGPAIPIRGSVNGAERAMFLASIRTDHGARERLISGWTPRRSYRLNSEGEHTGGAPIYRRVGRPIFHRARLRALDGLFNHTRPDRERPPVAGCRT